MMKGFIIGFGLGISISFAVWVLAYPQRLQLDLYDNITAQTLCSKNSGIKKIMVSPDGNHVYVCGNNAIFLAKDIK